MTNIWEKWKKIATAIANFQIKLILGLVYYILILPYWLGHKLNSRLNQLDKNVISAWTPHSDIICSLEESRKQF